MSVKVLLVDLNNFSRYPTVSVGILAGILRHRNLAVEVFSPLAHGVPSYPRKTRPKPWGLYDHWLRYWSLTTPSPLVRKLRGWALNRVRPTNDRATDTILRAAEAAFTPDVDVVLVSAYTMYWDVCRGLCRMAAERGVPIAVGGPYFSEPQIVAEWLQIPGLTALVGGEPEPFLGDFTLALAEGDGLSGFPGVSVPGEAPSRVAPPAQDLDSIPFPDYSNFPWSAYPNRILPILTGRGCGWGVCTFCSDVVTSSGRGFRSRSPENVLGEMGYQSERFGSNLFVFLDLKLNSDLQVWRALAERTQSVVPGAAWTASVHVGEKDSGLDPAQLRAARKGGLVRMTTGLESGSRSVLGSMAKGTDPERTSEFLRHAHEAGITMRLTAMIGYPGETPDDVLATASFLEAHQEYVDRVVLSPFAIQLGTPFHRRLVRSPDDYPEISNVQLNPRTAMFDHVNETFLGLHHRRAAFRLIRVIHRINRKPHTRYSREFEGVM